MQTEDKALKSCHRLKFASGNLKLPQGVEKTSRVKGEEYEREGSRKEMDILRNGETLKSIKRYSCDDEEKVPTLKEGCINRTKKPQRNRAASKKLKQEWPWEEVKKVLIYFQRYGSNWSRLVQYFPGRTENDLKNKFYATLKKVATRAELEDSQNFKKDAIKCKEYLLQFVEKAIKFGHLIPSKKGRRNKKEVELAKSHKILSHSRKHSIQTLPRVPRLMPSADLSRSQSPLLFWTLPPWLVPLPFNPFYPVPSPIPFPALQPRGSPTIPKPQPSRPY